MKKLNNLTFVSSLAVATAIVFSPATALAQDAEARAVENQSASESQAIVVTGSRIVRRDFVASSPIVTTTGEALDARASVTVDRALADLPQFTGISGENTIFNGFGETGAATLNLRNLGSSRNLVLLDGRRLQPSTTNFAVDVNSIPAAFIDNVEVITGGASATYGSDAVAGVVNFKLRRNFEGVEITAKNGISERGDYYNADISLAAGGSVADGKGLFLLGLNYSHREAVYMRDMPFFKRAWNAGVGGNIFLGTGYYQGAFDFGATGPNWPGFPFAAPPNIGFNTDHTTLFNPDTKAGYNSGTYPENPYYLADPNGSVTFNSNLNSYASIPLERYSAFGYGEYEITPSITAYGQVMFTHTDATTGGIPLPAANAWSVPIPRDAAHPIPQALADVLDTRPNPDAPWTYATSLTILGDPRTENNSDVYQFLVGLRGDVGLGDWTFDIYGSQGRASIRSVGRNGYALASRYTQLLSAPGYGAGFNDGTGGTCTSGISPFIDSSAVSADCLDYLNYNFQNSLTQTQTMAEVTLQGGVVDLPAGSLRLAVGADYRKNTLEYLTDSAYLPISTPTGIVSSMVGLFPVSPTAGKQSVKEFYAEALIPLLRDTPFAKSLELNLGYRYSDYDRSGGVSAFKTDAIWQLNDWLMFRGGYQRAVRAPNVTELFGGSQATLEVPAWDPCSNSPTSASTPPVPYPNPDRVKALCYAMTPNLQNPNQFENYGGAGVPVLTGDLRGNPNLMPEKANTFTVGSVLTLTGLPMESRLSLAVDYYNIDVSDAILALSPSQTTQLCFNLFGTNADYDPNYIYCQLAQRRPVNGDADSVLQPYQNQGGIKTSGIDATLAWNVPVGAGTLGLTANVNYLLNFKQSFVPGLPFVDYANTMTANDAYFRWRSLVNLSYQTDAFGVGLRWRHLPSARDASCVTVTGCQAPDTDAYNNVSLYGSIKVLTNHELSFGVDNLFNKMPNVVGGQLQTTNSAEYDQVGRQYYVGLKMKF